jgi:hypothetical protein
VEGELFAASFEHSANVYLEEGPRILEEEEGEPDPVGPAVDYLIDAVSTEHEARDANV